MLAQEELAPSVDRGCPMVLGGPLSHVMAAKAVAFAEARQVKGQPTMILARTIKGKGVSFMEGPSMRPGELYGYHSGAPNEANYAAGMAELLAAAPPLIEVRDESRESSRYSWGARSSRVEIEFRAKGERFLPTALASMAATFANTLFTQTATFAATSSPSVFHSPHASHFPDHLGKSAPHSVHRYTVLTRTATTRLPTAPVRGWCSSRTE